MNRSIWALIAVAALAACVLHARSEAQTAPRGQSVAHANSKFELVVKAPLNVTAPLFGPEGERAWAGDNWNPHFLYPTPARDVAGAVFVTGHGPHLRQWVLTTYDLKAGHIQYVITFPNALVTTLDIRLKQTDSESTRVMVSHEWTALSPQFNAHVAELSKMDPEAASDWQEAINQYINKQKR